MTKQAKKAKSRPVKLIKPKTIRISENLEESLQTLAALDSRDFSQYVRLVLAEHVRQKQLDGVLPKMEVLTMVGRVVGEDVQRPIANKARSRKVPRRKRQP